MRVCSLVRIAKLLIFTAAICVTVYLYLLIRQKHPVKNHLKQNYYARYYSSNKTVLSKWSVNANGNDLRNDLAETLGEVNGTNLEKSHQLVDIKTSNDISKVVKSDEFEKDIKQRQNVIRKACTQHGLDMEGDDLLHQPNPWEYFIADKGGIKIVWCNIFKSASSSWLTIFNQLAGYSQGVLKSRRIPPVSLARQRYPRPSVKKLVSALSSANAIGFLIARNPFERFISAYRDKIKGALPNSPHDKLGRRILMKYRHIRPKRVRHRSRIIPTFKEFVKYVLDEFDAGNELDMHWTPVYSFCNPCQVNLTHIIKFETFDRDTHALLEKVHLTHLLPPNGKLKKQNVAKGHEKTSLMVDTYLHELTPELLDGLRNLYNIDFDLFGYDKKEHFKFLES